MRSSSSRSSASGCSSRRAMAGMSPLEIEDIEVPLLLDGIQRRYGIDLRDYARSALRRKVRASMREEHVLTASALQAKLLHDPGAMERFVRALSPAARGIFRDPAFFRALRERAIPLLGTYPFVRIWHAGCGTGE